MAVDEITDRDITGNETFAYVRDRYSAWFREGSGEPADLADLSLSPDGTTIAAAAVLVEKLEGLPVRRICLIDSATGSIEMVSSSERVDRSPKWSPDGRTLLFISDRDSPYDFQVQLLEPATRREVPVRLDGLWVEAAHWSPDGRHILIAAAGRGVDLPSSQGGTRAALAVHSAAPSWAPRIEAGHDESEWRSLWLYEVGGGAPRRISPPGMTAWESAWCGNGAVVFVGSDGPDEEDWYGADLRCLDLESGSVRSIYRPKDQLGWPSASPSGDRIAIVEAVCSDRTIVAGTLLVGSAGGGFEPADSGGVDVTFTAWQSEDSLLYAGHRSFESVLALYDSGDGSSRTVWSDDQLTFGARYPEAAPGSVPGHGAILTEGYFRRPELVLVGPGVERTLLRLGDDALAERFEGLGEARPRRWTSADGLEIHGWLLEPKAARPHALVMDVHGGPVWLWRPRFVGRTGYAGLLFEQGFALFQPNARGSSGRGQDYARRVFGDMGGADKDDYLTGIDQLVADGIADPARLGILGGSYGGYMSAWLITQDKRFAAAAPLSPITDWVSEHLTCQIGHFCEMFVADDMTDPNGKYFSRSPIMFADSVETPTLLICGAADRNTPPGQGVEFHRALRMHGKPSVLLIYPGEGHGVRKMPASIDCTARLVAWFQRHMPAGALTPTES